MGWASLFRCHCVCPSEVKAISALNLARRSHLTVTAGGRVDTGIHEPPGDPQPALLGTAQWPSGLRPSGSYDGDL